MFLCLLPSQLLLAKTDSRTSFAHLICTTGGGEGGKSVIVAELRQPEAFFCLHKAQTDRMDWGRCSNSILYSFGNVRHLLSPFSPYLCDVVRKTESLTCTPLLRPSLFRANPLEDWNLFCDRPLHNLFGWHSIKISLRCLLSQFRGSPNFIPKSVFQKTWIYNLFIINCISIFILAFKNDSIKRP